MTEEVKTQVDDCKDFMQQAKLEVKQRARNAKLNTESSVAETVIHATGYEPTTGQKVDAAKTYTHSKLANARDTASQVGLEAKKKTRDAKLAFDKSAAGQATEEARISTASAASSAKEGVLDAVLPATKSVEATSTRGVDISHVENARNARLEHERVEKARRKAEARERAKEQKRQQMLDQTKAAVNEKTEAAAAVLAEVRDKAEVVLGSAALAAKDKIDELASDEPASQTQPRISQRGVDISSVSNTRNAELQANAQRKAELTAAAEPTLADKASAAISRAGASIKEAYVEATTDDPTPVYTRRQSAAGVDISSGANPANAELARLEEEKLKEERARALAREKAVVQNQVDRGIVQPLEADARGVEDDLGAKLNSLGASISRAATKLSAAVSAKYNELAHPVPLDVHEKKSESGIDTTSIANADNHVLGEQIKAEQRMGGLGALIAPSKEKALADAHAPTGDSAVAASVAAPDVKTAAIRAGLDAGVAAQDAAHSTTDAARAAERRVEGEARYAANKAKLEARELQAEATSTTEAIKSELQAAGDKVAAKLSEVTIAPTAL